MSPITERLMSLDPSLVLHNEGEWNGGLSAYSAFNSGGVECEVGEFLYAFLRLIKPDQVLETGTHEAVGASYMGMALKENGGGRLDTLEFLEPHFKTATTRLTKMGLMDYVFPRMISSLVFDAAYKRYQFMLLDTEPDIRFQEFLRFYDSLDEGGYIFIHDLGREMQQKEIPQLGFGWPFGIIPEGMKKLFREGKVRPFHFTTPRGLTGYYKVSKEDYDWSKA